MSERVVSMPVGLFCPAGGFHIDPWGPTARAVITHVHADHARPGSAAYLCAEPSAPFLRRRMGEGPAVQGVAYGERIRLGDVTVSLHPAGHVLGSAQIRIEAADGVWVISDKFEPVRADVFVTEATFALPIYRWPPPEAVAAEVMAWWDRNREAGVASLLFCYAMGKAQRLLAELGRSTDRTVLVHGAVAEMTEPYREQGVSMLPTARVAEMPARRSYAGELVLAPLSARGTTWMRRFGERETAFASGWMRVRGTRRRKGYDRGFVLSDHADWAALLQTRIGRQKLTPSILADAPVALMAYDLLEEAGEDLRERPLAERRARLEALLARAASPALRSSPAVEGAGWEDLARVREEARARNVEGLMLKRVSSPYRTGRRRGDWWKWKIAPYTIDAVLIYAHPGHGRRATLFTDYTFAVWDAGELTPVAKAYSGLSDAEIAGLDAWVRRHTRERFGPTRAVEPTQVFELAFEGIAPSSRHRSGVAVRFPRILRWRRDKPAAEADTLEGVKALLR